MTDKTEIDVGGGTLAVGILVAALAAAFLAFNAIATPTDFRARIAHVDAQISSAETTLRKGVGHAGFARSAVCADTPDRAVPALQARIQSAAAAAGVTVTNLTATPQSPGEGGVALTPISLSFEANGHYDAVLSMLVALSKQTPTVFVDSADLASQVTAVDFKFTGTVFCAARV